MLIVEHRKLDYVYFSDKNSVYWWSTCKHYYFLEIPEYNKHFSRRIYNGAREVEKCCKYV